MSAPLLNIAAISRRTRVAPDTLRKWEARYGVLRPQRTQGGQRRYSEQDVARVEWLRDRLAEGWRIGEAARMLEETTAPPVSDPEALREAITEATVSDDPARVGALLDQAFAVLPLEVSLEQVLTPALRWIGDEWHAGRLTVAQEHAATARVRAKLEQLMADRRAGVRGTAVLACAPGELHDLGLLMLAVALRADGWHVEYLGADTPVANAVSHAERLGAVVLCLSASRPDTATALEQGLADLPDAPSVAIVAGGSGIGADLGHGVRRSPDRVGDAVAELRALAA